MPLFFIMAGDRRQFERALSKWDRLHAEGAYSLPYDLGATAILCSSAGDGDDKDEIARDVGYFRAEGRMMADEYRAHGRRVELVENARTGDLAALLRDETISDVVTIGHGALSWFALSDERGQVCRFDWRDTAEQADHLKTGRFEQRHCGQFARRLSVPMGAFAMQYHHRVWAAVGQNFEPTSFRDDEEAKLTPVSNWPRLSYQRVLEAFDHDEYSRQFDSEELAETPEYRWLQLHHRFDT